VELMSSRKKVHFLLPTGSCEQLRKHPNHPLLPYMCQFLFAMNNSDSLDKVDDQCGCHCEPPFGGRIFLLLDQGRKAAPEAARIGKAPDLGARPSRNLKAGYPLIYPRLFGA
jgi:hypothetical protein